MESIKKPRGRAHLRQLLEQASASKVTVKEQSQPESCDKTESIPKVVSLSKGRGRADLVKLCRSQFEKDKHTDDSQIPSSIQKSHESSIKSISEKLDEVHLEEEQATAVPVEKKLVKLGEFGDRISVSTNYVRLYTDPSKLVYEYEVTFVPDLEFMNYRYRLLYEHFPGKKDILCYDGASKLFAPEIITDNYANYISSHPADDTTITMRVKLKKQAQAKDCAALYNTLFHNCSRILKLVRFGNKYFNMTEGVKIPQHKLEIWPGFVTAVDEFDGGIQLRCEVNHRILRTDTALDILNYISRQNPENMKHLAERDLLGQCVLTRYNNNLYRIDDIDWTKSPMSTFTLKGGEEITFLQYYKKQYNLDILDLKQPLLINKTKDTTALKGRLICLVPEICYMTGLTDKMRADMKVMKDIAMYTRITPSQRAYAFKQFLNNIRNSEEAQNMLRKWGLSIADDPIQLEARNLRSENIFLGKDKVLTSGTCDWLKYIREINVYRSVDILSWIIFFPKKVYRIAEAFEAMIKKVGPGLGLEIADPIKISLPDDRTETYISNLRQNITRKTQIVVCICPTAREDRYSAIKKFCCKDVPIPSQVVNVITLSRDDRMRSVVQNIALQMNHKIGGAGWAIRIPFQNTMVCGVDAYHENFHTVGSVGGFVASCNSDFTEWFSRTNFQGPKQEFINGIVDAFTAALKYYVKKNNTLPDRIIVYRDGVGDGQLDVCLRYEVGQFLEACQMISPGYEPKFSFVVVQKRICTKFYEIVGSQGKVDNPRPGGVVDDVITRKNFYDFYLVSQFVRSGTASPTHYLVLYDNSNIKPDHIQRLTYKFCHLYYNWPGTIRVPAPCQYAHKLAFLVGQNIKCMPDESLENKLYYL